MTTPLINHLWLESCPLHTETPETAAQAPAQVEAAFQRTAHVIAFTEVNTPDQIAQFTALATQYGYGFFHNRGDNAIAWKNVLDTPVPSSVSFTNSTGGQSWYDQITFNWFGRVITVYALHWPTATHAADRPLITQSLSNRIAVSSAGLGLSFYLGDTNTTKPFSDPTGQPRADLDADGLPLVWVELNQFPAAAGSTGIGSVHTDWATNANRVWLSDPLGSDHSPATAVYDITQPA